MVRTIRLTINGRTHEIETDDQRALLWVLREDLNLTGTKFGCGMGFCGACTVIVDRQAVRSCTTPVSAAAGKHVLTIEGLATDGQLHPLQQAFLERHAFQCGFCTPGMIMNAYGLLLQSPNPTRQEILDAMEGNLCRCGSYHRIVDAIEEAAARLRGGKQQ